MAGGDSTFRPWLRRLALPTALVLLVALNVALTFYFEPHSVLFGEDPISHGDLLTHAEQAWRVTDALDGWGKSWAYDVQLLAGYPNGTVFDADNKAWELWTYALWKVGIPRGTAFNMFILLTHLLLPLVIIASARLFRLDWWSTVMALAFSVALWFFDSIAHRCWWIGMQAFALAGYFFLLPLGFMYRYTRNGGWWRVALMSACLAVGHLIHPYIFIVLAGPMLILYVGSFRRMTPWQHAGVWSAALVAVLANLWWIVVALRFWHYVLDSGYYGSSTLSYIVSDYLGFMRDSTITGNIENRTGFRILVIGAAIAGLVSWRRSRDDRFLPFVVGLASMSGLVYLGGYVWLAQQVQPYRFLLPLIFTAVIPAAAFVGQACRSEALRRLPRIAWTTAGLIALVALPHLARNVYYFMPTLLPETLLPMERKPMGEGMGRGATTQKSEPHLRRREEPWDMRRVSLWIDRHHEGGRVLVENWILGEYLARKTSAPIIGGFRMRNMQHSAAFLFRRHPAGKVSNEVLKKHLVNYAISLVIVTRRIPDFEWKEDLLEPTRWIQPHRLYVSKVPWSYLQSGTGNVAASMNRIEVTSSDPEVDLVIRFHWLETLICTPECTIKKEPVPGDPVGFIRVPSPHPVDLVVKNGY